MRHLVLLFTAVVSALSSAPAHSDAGDQLFKLLAADGAAGDYFGRSVAVSGTTIIVGAPWDDDNGSLSGSAYLFDAVTGEQLFKLLPDDGAAWDRFGSSVAISGVIAIVGAPLDINDDGISSGSAYLFDAITGEQLFKLLPDDGEPNAKFGASVSISGSTAIVGAYWDDDNYTASGSAYIFDTDTGEQRLKLLPDDGEPNEEFGYSVAISGSTAIVGAPRDDDNGWTSGSAYIFDTDTGEQRLKLLPDVGAGGDRFGYSVSISGSIAIVGSYWDDDNGRDSGSAYLFDATTSRQIAKLLPDDGAADDEFGASVAISGAIAVVGADRDDDYGDDSGSAYLFDLSNPDYPTQLPKLLPSDGARWDLFGHSVAISGSTAIAGAHWDDDSGEFTGSAYLFDAGTITPCASDVDRDGDTDQSDLGILLASYELPPDDPFYNPTADLNDDGAIDQSDLAILLGDYGCLP